MLSEALYNLGDTLVGGGRLSLLSRLPTFRSQAPFVFTLPPPKAKGWAPLGPKGATIRHTWEGTEGDRPGAEQPSGSGMPGIQVTRGCEINGSSKKPRTAWR